MSLTTSFRLSIGLILLALLGLVVVVARAGEPTRPEGPASGSTAPRSEYYRKSWITTTSESNCLAQMEAAMRAMEPYLDGGIIDIGPKFSWKKYERERELAYRQWDDVKRACWPQPERE